MADANKVVWTTDWHLVSNDAELAGTGVPTTPTKATNVVTYLNGTVDPYGCFDTGDNKDHYYGIGTEDEHDNYNTHVGTQLRWLTLNAGDTNANFPNLPGNHDEYYDAFDTPPLGNNDFSTTYDVKFWGTPYHWTADWPAARVRFIAVHTYMHHAGTPAAPGGVDANGLAHITTAELDWLENEINTLPERWQSFVCSHFPVSENFGNNVKYTDANYNYSLTPFNDIMRDASTRVLAHLSGHRHSNWAVDTQDGVTHITSGGVSYGAANGSGSFTIMTYDPANRSITMDQRLATSPYARLSGMTPLVIQLQPHRLFFART